MTQHNQPSSSKQHLTGDQRLLVIDIMLIFLLIIAGILTLIFAPNTEANVVIPLVSLGVTALSGFASKPSFPVPAPGQPDPAMMTTNPAKPKEPGPTKTPPPPGAVS